MRTEVRHQGVVWAQGNRQPEEMLVDGAHEAGRPTEKGCPRTAPGVQRSDDGQPLGGEDGRQAAGDLRADDATDALGVVARVLAALDLDLPGVERAHGFWMPEAPGCDGVSCNL